jgi:integrase-like protein
VTFQLCTDRDIPTLLQHNVWQPPQFTFSPSPFATSPNRAKPTAPASPWQNGFAERLIGSIRRECVDHIIVLGEMHLRRVLES